MTKKHKRKFNHAGLAALRSKRGLTQTQLGEMCGADKSVVSHWETGRSAPRIDALILVADALGVLVDDLYTTKRAA